MIETETFFNRRYQHLERLGSGGMGTVFRTYDRLAGKWVALKRVYLKTVTEDENDTTRFDELRMALAQEFETLATLRHQNIISVLDYGFDSLKQPYYTMDLIENGQTIVEAARGKSLDYKIDLLLQTLNALAYLHRRGILHRDIKPQNILVVNDRIKVVDFGIAGAGDPEEGFVGTLAYMAPELIMGEGTSRASDLYAVGVLGYEILMEERLFQSISTILLIAEICGDLPDMRRIEAMQPRDQTPRLSAILEKLLAKTAEERYQDAIEVIQDLSAAIGRAVPPRVTLQRQGILQASQVVGREYELAILAGGLSQAIDGRGGAWILQGENGIGKTRLLEELRVMALVWGALVLPSVGWPAGDLFYKAWHEPLRRLTLEVDVLAYDAAVFKPFIPELEAWLGYPLPDAMPVPLSKAYERFLESLTNLIKGTNRPLLFLLDDLHEADIYSLELFKAVAMRISKLPVMVVGAFAGDARKVLDGYLAKNVFDDRMPIRLLEMEAFDTISLPIFITTVLGDIELPAEVFELVIEQTKGNAFLAIELLRTLAEDAGTPERVGYKTLNMYTFGEKGIIQRRLDGVPIHTMQLLEVAALMGIVFDVTVLQAFQQTYYREVDFAAWLEICENSGVIEVYDNRWRFAHTLLYKRILERINAKVLLHQRIAKTLEDIYGERAENDLSIIAQLSHHWHGAGLMDKAEPYDYWLQHQGALLGIG